MPDSDPEEKPSDARLARRVAAGALAAELGHDLQGSLNLFRSMTERVERGLSLDAEDAALLREELERLGGLSARLRELARRKSPRSQHMARGLVERALALPPSLAARPDFELAWDASADASISCDGSLVACALRELIDNALEARRARAGARFEPGLPPCLCVWDDGDGFLVDPGQAARFGVTTRPGAAGLGLAIALRALRAHGFRLEFARNGGITEARVSFTPSGSVG